MMKFKAHSLTGQISDEVMEKAFKAVKRNRGAAGLDKVSIGMYQANLEQNQQALMKKLKDRTYKATPLRQHYIPKGKGKFRAHGFRKGKNAHQAIERLLKLNSLGYKYMVNADITGFFDNLSNI